MSRERSIIFQIIAMLLFLSAHFISMFYFTGIYLRFFGIRVTGLIVDIALWMAIIFQILSIRYLVTERNGKHKLKIRN